MTHKLLIFGANGRSGRHVVRQALEAGHHVTAFVRDPAKLDEAHPNLTPHVGDVTDAESVDQAVRGHDAVLVVLGAPPSSTSWIRARGTENILAAMRANDVDRLICHSVYGVGDTRRDLPAYLRLLVVPFWLERAFADHAAQEQRILESDVDWTIVRPPFLTDGPDRGTYRHGVIASDEPIRMKVSRADVAAFMLKQLDDPRYVHASPWISD